MMPQLWQGCKIGLEGDKFSAEFPDGDRLETLTKC